ncbi:MAG: hypothetical protein ABIL27_02685 [candidate division WOR-3 bacterium]
MMILEFKSYFGIMAVRLFEGKILEDLEVSSISQNRLSATALNVLSTFNLNSDKVGELIDLLQRFEEGFKEGVLQFVYFIPWDIARMFIITNDYLLKVGDGLMGMKYLHELKQSEGLRDKILDIIDLPVDMREIFKALESLYPTLRGTLNCDLLKVEFSYAPKVIKEKKVFFEISFGSLYFGVDMENQDLISKALETLNLPRNMDKTFKHWQEIDEEIANIRISWDKKGERSAFV